MRAADPQRWSINLIRKALLLVAACFLTAIFIENLLAFRQYQLKSMAKDAFMEGAEYGFQKGLDNCVKPGGLLPYGETEESIANLVVGHRDEFTQGLYLPVIQGIHTAETNN